MFKQRFQQSVNKNFDERVNQFILEFENCGQENPSPEYVEYDTNEENLHGDFEAQIENAALFDEDTNQLIASMNLTNIFLTSYGQINGHDTISELHDQSIFHLITNSTPHFLNIDPFTYTTGKRYTSDKFYGIMIDTGASKWPTAGYGQFIAYKTINKNASIDTSTASALNVQFGIGSTSSLGSIKVQSPVGEITFHVVKADTPFLPCLKDIDRLGVYFNNLDNKLIQNKISSQTTNDIPLMHCFLTDQELRQLHRGFGHPSAHRLYRLLQRSGHNVNENFIERLSKYCHFCQMHGKSPGRFKFILKDDVQFNHAIFVDDILRLCWIDIYNGPPEIIVHDAGSNFSSHEFRQYAASMKIITKEVPVEAHQSIGVVERYHGPLRRTCSIISQELSGKGISRDVILQMAVKDINDTADPDGLVPTLLVFGTYPRMSELDPPVENKGLNDIDW
ncbi:hypothetical protein K3495_g13815 [Podosphaera aphanis]|nr:hypothetical protein K3495_g13815 [Podosphaera aphanis]